MAASGACSLHRQCKAINLGVGTAAAVKFFHHQRKVVNSETAAASVVDLVYCHRKAIDLKVALVVSLTLENGTYIMEKMTTPNWKRVHVPGSQKTLV